MNAFQRVALAYLAAMLFLGWGFAAGKHQVFPHDLIDEILAYARGDALGNQTSLLDKIFSDAGVEPRRYLRTYPEIARTNATPVPVPGLEPRREQPLVFIAPEHQDSYRAVFGALDFEGAFWGGVLLSPTGEALHTWQLNTDHLPTVTAGDEFRNLYGMHLYPDGSIIFTQQERGGGIVKVDACGNVQWNLTGDYHHTISPTEDGHFWTYRGRQEAFDHEFAKISAATGDTDLIIDMQDVRAKHPFLHIFNMQVDTFVRDVSDKDISHGNDIDPLPSALAEKFPQFEPGDLLLSYRTHNLVFVLDPDTLDIKWWRIGPWDRQHDPDWERDGTIAVFSNNYAADRRFSDIVAIDPATFTTRTVLDGERFGFYSSVNGDHELTEFGTRMVASTTQGWAFEVDYNNDIVFSFVNNYSRERRKSLNVSEAQRIPLNYFADKFWEQCP